MSQVIEHSGVVQHIDGKHIRVQIVQDSACGGCHAKSTCAAADMKDKYVDVEVDNTDLKPGDSVILYGRSSMGLLAVLLAFVVPFLLILSTLFVLKSMTDNEALSGTLALAVLVPYFIILSFFNQKLKATLKFSISRKLD